MQKSFPVTRQDQTRPDQTEAQAALLAVEGLSVRFATPEGEVAAVSEVSFAIAPGESLGVVAVRSASRSNSR